jgi:hypothetical protein
MVGAFLVKRFSYFISGNLPTEHCQRLWNRVK